MAATDKDGKVLTVGDQVLVRGVIEELSELENYVSMRLSGPGTVKQPDNGTVVHFKLGDVERGS